MNAYTGLADLKGALGLSLTATTHDAELLLQMVAASRGIDSQVGRHFWAWEGTRTYDGSGYAALWLPDDIVSIASIAVDEDADGTYELTLTTADYDAWPRNRVESPIMRLDLRPWSSRLTMWPRAQAAVQITGVFGFSREVEAAGTLASAIADATTTSVTMTSGHSVQAGDTVLIDAEQMWVSAVSGDVLTVTRGVNGTTASSHSNGAAVQRRRYPRDIEDACRMQTARLWREGLTGMTGQVGGDTAGWSFGSAYPAIRDILSRYRRSAGVW